MMRKRAVALLGVTALVSLALARPAGAQESESQLGGYVAGAAGWAFSFQPFLPALLPTGDAPVETTFSLSTASVKSGGIALGRAAIVWPGSAAANLGPLIEQAAGQPGFAGLVPPYPGAVEASARDGEVLRSVSPLVTMRAFGSASRAEGDSRTPDVNLPGVLKIDSVSSNSVAEVSDVDVTSGCTVHLEGVTLLGGAIKIAAIHSRSITTSTGSSGTAGGDLEVAGLTIAGIKAELTAAGLHATGLPSQASPIPGVSAVFPGTNPDAALNKALASLGVSMTLTRPVDKVNGATADRLANGVLISIVNPAVAGGRFDVTLASTGSSAQATPLSDLAGGGLDLGAAGGDLTGALPATSVLGSDTTAGTGDFASSNLGGLALGPSGTGRGLTGTGAGTALGTDLSAYHFKGVSWQLVLLLLAVSALLARWMRTFLRTRLIPVPRSGDDTDEGVG
jgi:hypothetical protein